MLIIRSTQDLINIQSPSLKKSIKLIFRSFNFNKIIPRSREQFGMSPNVYRQKKIYTAIVQKVINISSSIKVLRLSVKEPGFSFKAGQWVDFHIPGIKEITGYSMTSAPFEAKQNSTLDLAVKEGNFPPTNWVHSKCQSGEEIKIRVGGDFYYDPEEDIAKANSDLLLIGGGVGINPLVSILSHYCYLVKQKNLGISNVNPDKVHLFYSAKTEKELVFKEIFLNMARTFCGITCQFFVTEEISSNPKIKYRRIEISDVANSIEILQKNQTLCYICGPSNMTDEISAMLSSLHVKNDYIKYEKWW